MAIDDHDTVYIAQDSAYPDTKVIVSWWDGYVVNSHILNEYKMSVTSFSANRMSYFGGVVDVLTTKETPTPPDYLDTITLHHFDTLNWTMENMPIDMFFGSNTVTLIDGSNSVYAHTYINDLRLYIKSGSTTIATAEYSEAVTTTVSQPFAYKNNDDSYTVFFLRTKSGNTTSVAMINYANATWKTPIALSFYGGMQIRCIDVKSKAAGQKYVVCSTNSGGPQLAVYSNGSWAIEVIAPYLSTNAYACAIAVPGAVDQYYD